MLLFFLAITASVNAQVNIGSEDAPKNGAVLDLSQSSTPLGLILPNVPLNGATPFQLGGSDTKDLEDYPAAAGTIVYNNGEGDLTDVGVYVWSGTAWTLASAPVVPPVEPCTKPATPGTITITPTTVTAGETFIAFIDPVDEATGYEWNVPSTLSIQSGQNTTQVTYLTSSETTINAGSIQVTASNECGPSQPRYSVDAVVVSPPQESWSCVGVPAEMKTMGHYYLTTINMVIGGDNPWSNAGSVLGSNNLRFTWKGGAWTDRLTGQEASVPYGNPGYIQTTCK